MKKLLSLSVAFVMVLSMLSGMIVVSAADLNTDIMVNGGFENSTNSWFDIGSSYIYLADGQAHAGSHSLALDGLTDHTQWTRAISANMTLDASSTYTISWYSKVNTDNYALLYVYSTDSESAGILGVNGLEMASASNTDWTYHSVDVTTTTATAIRLGIKTKGNAGSACATYVDDIAVTKTAVSEDTDTDTSSNIQPWTNSKIPTTLVSSAHFSNSGNIIDGDASTPSWSDGNTTWTNYSYVVDLGTTYDLEGYNLYGGNKTSAADPYSSSAYGDWDQDSYTGGNDHAFKRMPSAWKLYSSLDGNSWKPMASVTGNTLSLVQGSLSGYSSRYIKYVQQGNFNFCEWGCIREFEVYGAESSSTVTTHKVTFIANDSTYSTVDVTDSFFVSEPARPAITGFDFKGWYTDETYSTLFDFANTSITSDTTIYAKLQTAVIVNQDHYITVPVANVTSDTANFDSFGSASNWKCKYWFSGGNIACGAGGGDAWNEIKRNNATMYANLGSTYKLEAVTSNARTNIKFVLYGSNDMSAWTPLTNEVVPTASEYMAVAPIDNGSYQYVKMVITSNPGWNDWTGINLYGTEYTAPAETYAIDGNGFDGGYYNDNTGIIRFFAKINLTEGTSNIDSIKFNIIPLAIFQTGSTDLPYAVSTINFDPKMAKGSDVLVSADLSGIPSAYLDTPIYVAAYVMKTDGSVAATCVITSSASAHGKHLGAKN